MGWWSRQASVGIVHDAQCQLLIEITGGRRSETHGDELDLAWCDPDSHGKPEKILVKMVELLKEGVPDLRTNPEMG